MFNLLNKKAAAQQRFRLRHRRCPKGKIGGRYHFFLFNTLNKKASAQQRFRLRHRRCPKGKIGGRYHFFLFNTLNKKKAGKGLFSTCAKEQESDCAVIGFAECKANARYNRFFYREREFPVKKTAVSEISLRP